MKSAAYESRTPVPQSIVAPLRIAIVDDIQLFRDCVAAVLADTPGCEVTAEANTVTEGLERCRGQAPDIYLVSISLPRDEALELTRWVSREQPGSKVLLLGSDDDDPTQVLECIEAGAAGYVSRRSSLAELKKSLQALLQGETLVSPRLTHSVFLRLAEVSGRKLGDRSGQGPVLTARELEILELVADGLSNKEIAKKLIISLHTVKNHVHNILEKLEVGGRYAAVTYAQERRWLRRRWR
jgi:DNA-binding NarL/FixJ family response regulator